MPGPWWNWYGGGSGFGFVLADGTTPFTAAQTFPDGLVLPTSLKIGATVEVYNVAFVDNVGQLLSLDPADASHVAYYHSHGLTLNGDKNKFVIPQDGRYLFNGTAFLSSHATAWFNATFLSPGGGESASRAMAPDNLTGASHNETLHVSSIAEFSAGAEVGWFLTVTGADRTLLDSYLSIQYLGPKTG